MPRQARLGAPGTLHHLIIRGIEGKRIFRDTLDRKDFVTRILAVAGEPFSWILSREYGVALAEISRQLGVCASAIAKAIRKKEEEDQRCYFSTMSPNPRFSCRAYQVKLLMKAHVFTSRGYLAYGLKAATKISNSKSYTDQGLFLPRCLMKMDEISGRYEDGSYYQRGRDNNE